MRRETLDARFNAVIGTATCVIDLGCGSGHILSGLSGRFEQRIGMDVSRRRLEEMADSIIEGWEFRKADLNGIFPLEDDLANAVIANQVR